MPALALRLAMGGLLILGTGLAMVVVGALATPAGSAFADSAPYELYCPDTPVGNIALNDVETTGTITPASVTPGGQFSLDDFQSQVALPATIATAAAALGNSVIAGTATVAVDASGATPTTISSGTLVIDAPIPDPVPSTGLILTLPATPVTVGPFTAGSSGTVTLSVDPDVNLALDISGSTLTLTCTPYPNDSEPAGIVESAPSGPPTAPTIDLASIGGAGTTTTSTPSTTSTSSTTSTTSTTTTSPPVTTARPTTTVPPCYRDPEGGCYQAGEFCPTALRGETVEGQDGPLECVDDDGWRWEAPGPSTAASASTTGSAVATSAQLAFTGPGPAMQVVLGVGALLCTIGVVMLVAADVPRRLAVLVATGRTSAPDRRRGGWGRTHHGGGDRGAVAPLFRRSSDLLVPGRPDHT
ncbi:MAG TPA: hypothetical protein VMB72_11315 [Acidimicrobiales bacterium]|nr:hypothetical protein [Acidimicrobiales bacterium]